MIFPENQPNLLRRRCGVLPDTPPVRVALVIGQLTRGGAEQQLQQLALGMDRKRFAPFVYVLSRKTEPHGAPLVRAGVPMRVLTGSAVRRTHELARAFREDEIQIVHAWLYLANPIAALAAKWAGGLALVTSARNCKVHGPANRLANAWAFCQSRRILVNSEEVARFITRAYWASPERIRVVPNGIDLERFAPAPKPAGNPPWIVTAGRLVEQKNHRLFLQAAAALHALRPEVRFAIAGSGPLREALELEQKRLGLCGVVEFLGERPDIEEVLRKATLFWLTSSWEGMPNVVLEAMACGVPVIASDVSGVRELLGETVAGTVVPSREAQAWVEASLPLLDDPRRHGAASAAARQRAGEFSVGRMIERTMQVYDEAVR